jgi:hypothetical protein
MKRRQLFEFDELGWYPTLFRDAITDALRFFSTRLNIYGPAIPLLKGVMEGLGCREIVDLGSGGSGPIQLIQGRLKDKENYPVKVTLTDLFPNIEAFKKAGAESRGSIDHIETPVDATDVPEYLTGFRTMFASFHHFKPEKARMILQDAWRKRVGIGVFEFTNRSPAMFVVMLFSPILILLVTPFIRPISWKKLFWTYLVPLIPLTGLWDGIVSYLRTYSPGELEELVKELESDDYVWEIGQVHGIGLHKITYLFGYPA